LIIYHHHVLHNSYLDHVLYLRHKFHALSVLNEIVRFVLLKEFVLDVQPYSHRNNAQFVHHVLVIFHLLNVHSKENAPGHLPVHSVHNKENAHRKEFVHLVHKEFNVHSHNRQFYVLRKFFFYFLIILSTLFYQNICRPPPQSFPIQCPICPSIPPQRPCDCGRTIVESDGYDYSPPRVSFFYKK